MSRAFEFVDEAMTDAMALSSQAYILKEDQWKIFVPSEEHVLYRELKTRRLITEKEQFDDLEHLINEKMESLFEKESFFVASFNQNVDDNLRSESFAVWVQRYDTIIMPIADNIILDVFDENEKDEVFKTSVIPIAKLMGICENRFSACRWSSQYVTLQGFPSTEELEQLGVNIERLRVMPS